jgi:WD40 repeat protein/tRNA A-37 threonylcarbamoyl transferase component Bud32
MVSMYVYCDNCGAANRVEATLCFACNRPLQSMAGEQICSSTAPLVNSHLLIQRYRILGQLGRGGFGAVYQAEDIQFGNRAVAIKEMNPVNLSPQEIAEATEAFKHEALLLANLTHPNLPRIYDHFSDSGRWYLVMDFIEGETLEEYLQKAPGGYLPVKEVLDIGIQLCSVLGYLHACQPPIIFRDLKPANIMRTAEGNYYLIDFGIARHFKPGQAKDTMAFGSPGYAAPEQYGRRQTTPHADIYSLGATLHHLLTGDDPSLTPFRFAPFQFNGQLATAGLDTLIMQMIEVDERKRPASMAMVRQELQRIAIQRAAAKALTVADQSPSPVVVRVPSARKMLYTYTGHSGYVTAVAWSPDGARIASASEDETIQVWNATSGQTLFTSRGHPRQAHVVAWSPDSRYIASGCWGNSVGVWDAATGQRVATYRSATVVTTLAWSPDGKYIASANDDKVRIWDAKTGENLFTYRGHFDLVYVVAWSPDGAHIASASGKTAHIWDAGKRRMGVLSSVTYRGHADAVQTLAWSPDSKCIVSGSRDTSVHVWDSARGDTICIYNGHEKPVKSVVWSGPFVASAGLDMTIHLWDAITGDTMYTYTGHASTVTAVAWSPDGTRIASGSWDKTVRIWQAV